MDVYSDNKFFHYKDKLLRIANRQIVSPINLQIDLTNRCNNNCIWCSTKIFDLEEYDESATLSEEVATKMLESFKEAGGRSVQWVGGGEPTVAPHFKSLTEKARALGLGQVLITNGKNLKGPIAEACKYFDGVRVSLNSASASMYKRQHGNDSFFSVVNNIENFARVKNPECLLGVSMIVDDLNYKEIEALVLIAKALGADNARISLAYTPKKEKLFDGIWDKVLDRMRDAKSYEDDNFRVFAFGGRIDDLGGKNTGGRCYYHHLSPTVGANGAVYPCCILKYRAGYSFGNLNDESFIDILNSEKRRKFINTVGENCESTCWMAGKNKLADYIIMEPKDVPHLAYP